MQNQSYIYCFVAKTQLNMFRALLCPSSGAPSNCLCSLWLPYDCRVGRVSNCGPFTSDKAINIRLIVHLAGSFIEYLKMHGTTNPKSFLLCCCIGCAINYVYFIIQQAPLKNSTPKRTQTWLDKVNIYVLPTYIINNRKQQILMCCSKDFN
jgi:hypothetical protein